MKIEFSRDLSIREIIHYFDKSYLVKMVVVLKPDLYMFKRIVLFLSSFKSQLYVLKGWVVDNAGKKLYIEE